MVATSQDGGSLCQRKDDVAFDLNGSSDVVAGGDAQNASSVFGAGVDGFLERFGVEGFAVANDSIVENVEDSLAQLFLGIRLWCFGMQVGGERTKNETGSE